MRGNGSKSNQWTKTDDIIAGTLLRENVKEQNDGNAHHAKETKETPRRDQGAGDCDRNELNRHQTNVQFEWYFP